MFGDSLGWGFVVAVPVAVAVAVAVNDVDLETLRCGNHCAACLLGLLWTSSLATKTRKNSEDSSHRPRQKELTHSGIFSCLGGV